MLYEPADCKIMTHYDHSSFVIVTYVLHAKQKGIFLSALPTFLDVLLFIFFILRVIENIETVFSDLILIELMEDMKVFCVVIKCNAGCVWCWQKLSRNHWRRFRVRNFSDFLESVLTQKPLFVFCFLLSKCFL